MKSATHEGDDFRKLLADDKRPLSWKRFVALASKVRSPSCRDQFFFRGQSNAEWKIRPLLLRYANSSAENFRDHVLKLEQAAIIEFQRTAYKHFPNRILPRTLDHSKPKEGQLKDWWTTAADWWALMQHYGAPTRLMDWTRSPYIAAYFAANENFDEPGKVWCCDKTKLDEVMQRQFDRGPYLGDFFPENEPFEQANKKCDFFFVDSLERSGRHHGQQGCFMMCKDPTAILGETDEKGRYMYDGKEWLHELEIPRKGKPRFLRQLRLMNVTAHSLFPDIQGLGPSVLELVRCMAHS